MAEHFCERFFYPEVKYPKCDNMIPASGRCTRDWRCPYQLNLNNEEHAILDNMRIVKAQNATILEQNEKILFELCGLQKTK